MRFARIDLDRYGCFTSHRIDFGPSKDAGDFHLVYGPNEAGKSTLRDACIDFLFGFPHQTPYKFLHPNELLQIGAHVETSSARHELRRTKQKDDLLGADGRPAPAGVLSGILGDVSRTSYEQMFSLDEDSLEEGGKEILRSEGDLGALLFSAASGLSSLSAGLEAIQADADAFYKKSGRTHALNASKTVLKALQDQVRDIDVQASAYEKLRTLEAEKQELHAQAKSERDRNAAKAERLKAFLDAVAPWRELQDLERDLEAVADTPDLPSEWLSEAEKLVARDASAKSAVKEGAQTVERGRAAIDAIEVDEPALAFSAAVKGLTERDLEVRFRTSKDIESRRRELNIIEQDIEGVLVRLGRPQTVDPSTLVLPAAIVGTLREFIEQRSGLLADASNAAQELEGSEVHQSAARAALDELGAFADLTTFADRVANTRDAADRRALEAMETQCSELSGAVVEALSTLSPWQGDGAALLATGAPDAANLQALKAEAGALHDERKALATDIENRKDEKAGLEAEIGAAVEAGGIVDDREADAALTERDAAWQRHREGLDANPIGSRTSLKDTADAFEAAMAENDKTAGTRLRQSSALSALQRSQADLAKCEASLVRLSEKQDALDQRSASHGEDVSAWLRALGLPATMHLESVEIWLAKREAALSRVRELSRTQETLRAMQARFEDAMASIGEAMANHGLDPEGMDWHARLKSCDDAIAAWEVRKRSKVEAEEKLRQATEDVERRKRRHDQAVSARAAWDTDWHATLASCWIGEGSPASVQEILRVLEDLAVKLPKANELQSRIAGMQSDREAYEAEVRRLCEDAGEPFDSNDPFASAEKLRGRVAAAEEAARQLQDSRSQLKDAEGRLAEAQEEMAAIAARISEMSQATGAKDLEALIAALKRSAEKSRLVGQIERLQKTLQSAVGTLNFTDARNALDDALSSPDEIEKLRSDHQALRNARDDEDAHVSELFHDWKTAEDALAAIGGDDQVARLEEQRRVLLLDLEQEAHTFMRLSAGAALVGEALRTYRETHRSSMMRHASGAFAAITRGAFRGLVSAPGKKSEVLVGVRRDGSSIVASEMSRGTRFQLYLALRIAGHAEFAKHRETLPFFADDVLEPFDDDRSAETFALLSLMSKQGQVVYLTHHRHLCDLAKSVCGDAVTIHELPDRAVSG